MIHDPPLAGDRTPLSTPAPAPDEQGLKVVGIGASAGGLDALEKLFTGLPPDVDACFVVIQHLSPDHKSIMDTLLGRHTAMPVIMVEDGMRVEPNRVYLIPPGSIMHMEGRHLRLTPKGARSLILPIDVFFQSLAKHHGPNAIGVILSGTGSDGTRGAVAINEAGGFLLVQAPEDARFDGMPRSAIGTGLVDDILPVDSMPARILSHLRAQPTGTEGSARTSVLDESLLSMPADTALTNVLHVLLHHGGVNFEDYKPGTVLRRIERRMAVRQVSSIQGYLELLNHDRAEVLTLRHELLIPVTSFFRDPEAFSALAQQVVEPLVASREAGQTLRVWCAGVSTGEEAYSVAMLFLEAFEQLKRWPSLKIFATDVEQMNVETGASGSYPESIVAEITPERLERFFHKKGNHYVVKNELRQCIVFARHNLLSDPPFTKMDLVVCRNALIYFRSPAQAKVLHRLHYALTPRGYLFLGSSETLGDLQRDFHTLSARQKIWQVTRPATPPLELNRTTAGASALNLSQTRPAATRTRRMSQDAVEMGQQALMQAFGPPPAVLLNAAHELVHAFGNITPFVKIREGQITLDINRMLPDPLIPVAAAVLFKSAREGGRITSDAVRVPLQDIAGDPAHPEGAHQFVKLTAMPAGDLDGERQTLLVFERLNVAEKPDQPASLDLASETTERIEALEHELSATRESLQATIEELETSNEELQATNEEMMASNEELQSSNEELQSVNEELNTVNAEYQEKIDILNRINADLDNLTKVVATGTVFVDDELRLVRFSPEAAGIFRLRDSDLGRPLEDLNHHLDYPGLLADLKATLHNGQMLSKDVDGAEGRRFMVRMLPYHIPSTSARGVVISFVEVTKLHQALQRQQLVIDALGEHVAVLDTQGDIVMVNQAWRTFAACNGDAALQSTGVGANYLDACRQAMASGDAYARTAAESLARVLRGELRTFTLEYPCDAPDEPRWFVMHVAALGGAQPGAVVSHVNITGWRQQAAASHGR